MSRWNGYGSWYNNTRGARAHISRRPPECRYGMLAIMTESEEPVLRSATSRRSDLESVRTCGTVALLVGGMLSVAALVFSAGEPSWQVLGIFAMVAVIGLGMRLEAAIRERSRS